MITPAELPELRARSGPFPIIVSVAHAGPRGEVRSTLERLGLVELRDYICAA